MKTTDYCQKVKAVQVVIKSHEAARIAKAIEYQKLCVANWTQSNKEKALQA